MGGKSSSNLFISGSHDSLVKMWDIRYSDRALFCYDFSIFFLRLVSVLSDHTAHHYTTCRAIRIGFCVVIGTKANILSVVALITI